MGGGCIQLHPRVYLSPFSRETCRDLWFSWFFLFFFLRQIHFSKVNSIPSHLLSPTEFLSCLEQVKAGQQGGGKVLWSFWVCYIMQGRAANLLQPPPSARPIPRPTLRAGGPGPLIPVPERVVVEGKPLPRFSLTLVLVG